VINVQPDQASDFQATLAAAGVKGYDWYPMIRGRLVAINGEPIGNRFAEDERARRLTEREFNLSHVAGMPPHNRIVEGQWTAGEADGMSIEQGLAETMGVKLGDKLRFDIAGTLHEARITSVRKVDWGSMRANFFVLYPLNDMPELPETFMAAFR